MSHTVYLRRSDPTVERLIQATFPAFRGKTVQAHIETSVEFHGAYWDGGSKREYRLVRLADLSMVPVPDRPYQLHSEMHDNSIQLPDGVVCVVLDTFMGRDSVEIISSAANSQPLLPAPTEELTEDEKRVLVVTRSLKSSYAGIKDYRFHESGMSRERYDNAKASLIGKKLLNKAGAITVEGRNLSQQFDRY